MPFFTKKSKPSDKKNPVQNYMAHCCFLGGHLGSEVARLKKLQGNQLMGELELKVIGMFNPLRDGHDWADEMLGTAVSGGLLLFGGAELIALSALFAGVGYALYHSAVALFIRADLMQSDTRAGERSHSEKAVTGLVAGVLGGVAALVGTALFLLKSSIGMVVRPCVTAATGWAKQDTERFYYPDSVQAQAESYAAGL